jgi:hypothetical protein
MPNKLLVRNPMLNEFVWDLLYNITDEQKKRLSKPHLLILKSSVKTKNFCEFSTLDEKVRLFSELGIENAIVFFQDKINSVNGLKKILEKYEQDKQAGAANEIAKLKVFVSSDKNVKWLLSLMADTIHHKSYFLNLEYNRLGYHIKGWTKDRNLSDSKQVSESIENSDLLVTMMLNSAMAMDYIDGLLGISALDMKVLLYLYGYRHTYLEKGRIWDFFTPTIAKGKVNTSMKRLFMNEYIKKHIDYTNQRYTITTAGIDFVTKFTSHIMKQNQF